MNDSPATTARNAGAISAETTTVAVILALSFCHMLNDMLQALLPALYPILKTDFDLNFAQVGLITCTLQVTASLLQPPIGYFADRKARSHLLPLGMGFTFIGILAFALTNSFTLLLVAVGFAGIGSAVFHPEASRIARAASGGRHGFAQSIFQVGGTFGSAAGPLLAAIIVLPYGRTSAAWFALAALLAMVVLTNVSGWYKRHHLEHAKSRSTAKPQHHLPRRTVILSLVVLVTLMFSKFIYIVSLSSYYTFYLIDRFGVSVQSAQLHLFLFFAASAVGTVMGGPLGDRFGRKYVIWGSIFGVVPFTLLLPHATLLWTGVLSVVIGVIISGAFAAMVVYGQELLPGRIGLISGLFFGLSFGVSGLAAAGLGVLADYTSIRFVYEVVAYLPLLGLLAVFLPNFEPPRRKQKA